VTQLDAGSNTTCAVTDDGSVYCWGNVQYVLADAERPNPTNGAARAPTLAPYVTDAVSVTTEGFVTCVTTSTDRAHCWGPATAGATGNGHVEEWLDYSADPVVWAG
jgi:alpha-tubulin suppressor-like RCC1 family protein